MAIANDLLLQCCMRNSVDGAMYVTFPPRNAQGSQMAYALGPIAQAMADQVARDEADLRAKCLAKWFAQYLDERRLR